MPSPVRLGLVAAFAIACHGALAQTSPTLTVQRIAPQLVAFAGSQANFQNLVTGLAQGTQIQLFTLLPDGFTQVVTFTPAGPLSPDQIAQVLETARQRLIGLGIGAPTGEQLAAALVGGTVPTPLGGAQIAGLLTPQTAPSPAVQIQQNAAAGASAGTQISTTPLPAGAVPTTSISTQLVPGASQRINTSDSFVPAGATSRSPTPGSPPVPGMGVAPTPAQAAAGAAPQPGATFSGPRTAR